MFIKNFMTNLFDSLTDNLGLKNSRSQMADQIVDELVFNSLKGKKYFDAICLTEPIVIQQRSMVINTGVYYPIRVRPVDIYNFIIPDPCSMDDPNMIARAIQNHPIAFAIRPQGHGERLPTFGDTIRCHFSIAGPNNSGAIRGIRYDLPKLNHEYNYECAEKVQRAASLFGDNPLRLLELPEPTNQPAPAAIIRTERTSAYDCEEEFSKCYDKVQNHVRTQEGREPVDSDFLECHTKQLECEERTAYSQPEWYDQWYWYPRTSYTKIGDFHEWLHWNNMCGNIPKISVKRIGFDDMKCHAQWPYTRPDKYCSGQLSGETEIRFLNAPDKVPLPHKVGDRFTAGTTPVDESYVRTMVLRALPFMNNYKYPYSESEFAEHLNQYPELAHHWVIQTGEHLCQECIAHAKRFLETRTDSNELLEKAKDPKRGGVPPYAQYMYDPNFVKPEPKTYTVLSGDYLNKISNKTGVSVQNLRDWNKLSGNTIHPGQKLVIEDTNASRFTEPGHPKGIVYFGGYDHHHNSCY